MDTPTRRHLLRVALAGGAGGLAGCTGNPDGAVTSGESDSTTPDDDPSAGSGTPATALPSRVALESVATGFRAPVDVAFVPDVARYYVADQSGVIRSHERDDSRETALLDLSGAAEVGGEKGLLGIALHPAFASNRRLFVRYSAPRREGTPETYSHTFVLAEFSVRDDGLSVDPDSEQTIIEIPQPQANHNAGDIVFGPDGYLYVAVGDGGAGGDRGTGHVDDWYDATDGGNGQDVTKNLLGSILRLDVDDGDEGIPYSIPADNPLVGREGLDEHWAWGLRNPWRMAFDDGDLFVGDVGQNRFEEINVVERGGNYGWNVMEGSQCYSADDCPDRTPADVRGGERLRDPIVEYPHSTGGVSGDSVIGGEVYRGSALPSLEGAYLFGDLNAGGQLFVATRPADGSRWPATTLPVDGGTAALERILSFGRDADGEVYVLGAGADSAGLYRVVPA